MNHAKIMIVGSGPAGYTAAIYAGRAGLSPIIMEGMQPGGQLTITTEVDNYPGFSEGIDANELMDSMRAQAERFGAKIEPKAVAKVELGERPFHIWTDEEEEWTADTLVIATGASAKYLGLPDEQKYMGMGVSACATCDGFFYRRKVVAVVGGGDTACEEASYLASLASKVYMIVRKPYLRASQIMQERVMQTPNIEILFENTPTGLYGENGLEGVHLTYRAGQEDQRDDIVEFVKAFSTQFPKIGKKDAILVMAHGTPHPANAYYSVVQNRLDAADLGNVFIYSVEGWPHLNTVIPQLKAKGIENVILMPMMMVAGDHANNDMAGADDDSHKSILEKEGFKVTTYIHGLGENEAVRQMFVERADEAWQALEAE